MLVSCRRQSRPISVCGSDFCSDAACRLAILWPSVLSRLFPIANHHVLVIPLFKKPEMTSQSPDMSRLHTCCFQFENLDHVGMNLHCNIKSICIYIYTCIDTHTYNIFLYNYIMLVHFWYRFLREAAGLLKRLQAFLAPYNHLRYRYPETWRRHQTLRAEGSIRGWCLEVWGNPFLGHLGSIWWFFECQWLCSSQHSFHWCCTSSWWKDVQSVFSSIAEYWLNAVSSPNLVLVFLYMRCGEADDQQTTDP